MFINVLIKLATIAHTYSLREKLPPFESKQDLSTGRIDSSVLSLGITPYHKSSNPHP